MISISPKTFINVNPDGSGGYYIWVVKEVNSMQGIVKECERAADGKWLFIFKCEHAWTKEDLFSELNIHGRLHANLYMTTPIDGVIHE